MKARVMSLATLYPLELGSTTPVSVTSSDRETVSAKNYPTDTLLNFDFIVGTKLALLETHPSMVGHIGYYRENLDGGKGIGEISTDIRFKLDDGQGLEAKGEASTKTGKLIGKSNTDNSLVVSYK